MTTNAYSAIKFPDSYVCNFPGNPPRGLLGTLFRNSHQYHLIIRNRITGAKLIFPETSDVIFTQERVWTVELLSGTRNRNFN